MLTQEAEVFTQAQLADCLHTLTGNPNALDAADALVDAKCLAEDVLGFSTEREEALTRVQSTLACYSGCQ